jgi:hypothetical protein
MVCDVELAKKEEFKDISFLPFSSSLLWKRKLGGQVWNLKNLKCSTVATPAYQYIVVRIVQIACVSAA